jgi:hypothetical protein
MTVRDRTFWSGILLAIIGLELAINGAELAWHMLCTDSLVRTAIHVRNGGLSLPKSDLLADAAQLDERSGDDRTADEAGALVFLYYAAAQISQGEGNAGEATQELMAARKMCVQTLALAPTRADVALALAEIEFLLGSSKEAVERPLILSYLTAPRELWIIERRIGLGLRLASAASPELLPHILSDIDTLGEPYRDTGLYRDLAQAAHSGGPYAVALVRRELGTKDPEPLAAFNAFLAQIEKPAAATSQHS